MQTQTRPTDLKFGSLGDWVAQDLLSILQFSPCAASPLYNIQPHGFSPFLDYLIVDGLYFCNINCFYYTKTKAQVIFSLVVKYLTQRNLSTTDNRLVS